MSEYIANIEKETLENENFRTVLFTSTHLQLVVMALKPLEDIGTEIHDVDQLIRIEKGSGKSIINGVEHEITEGSVVVIPAGAEHNIVNGSQSESMKLYTLYSPPHHPDGTIHKTKADAAEGEHAVS